MHNFSLMDEVTNTKTELPDSIVIKFIYCLPLSFPEKSRDWSSDVVAASPSRFTVM